MEEPTAHRKKYWEEIGMAGDLPEVDEKVYVQWLESRLTTQSARIRELVECRQCLYDALDLFRLMEEQDNPNQHTE